MAARTLITGISGQDGSYLAELLIEQGCEVVGLVRGGDGGPLLEGVRDRVRLVTGDLVDPLSLRRVVADVQPEHVFHLAAPTFVPDSWRDPTAAVVQVAGGTAALLAAVLEHAPDARLVAVASSEIFGDAGVSPQDERSPMRPRSPYGVAKLAAFGLVRAMRERHGLHAASAITYNHESPRRAEHFLPRKVTRAAAAISLGLQEEAALGDLDAVRDWCDARDVVRAFVLMAAADEPADIVLASGEARTVGSLVDAAFAAAGVDPDGRVRVDPAFVRPPEATVAVGDPSLAAERLGWRPEIAFEQTIADMVAADLASLRAASPS